MNNVDKEGARKYIYERSPFIEYQTLYTDDKKEKMMTGMDSEAREKRQWTLTKTIENAKRIKSPRLIKTHLPLSMLPPNLLDTCKVIYVCRNPKDTCVSYYHHTVLLETLYEYEAGFEEFEKSFRKGEMLYGSYWFHLKVSDCFSARRGR